MLAKRIIPCLDVRDGKVVKGVQFRDHVIVGDIVDLARRYQDVERVKVPPEEFDAWFGEVRDAP